MTQHQEIVEKRRVYLEAMDWAKGIENLHMFNTFKINMWYDNRRSDGQVTDITYNDGTILRELKDGSKVVMQEGISGEELINKYRRSS